MNLYLLHYNNYYNRIVKKEETLSDYLPYQIGETIENINFIPNDFINTEQIVNWQDKDPDYLIVADEDNNIVSRWFVISTMRTRAGQLRLNLHRDLVVDFYSNIITSPAYIEKATLQPNDPMIFNKEDIKFNQIKTSETPLKDETESAWVVGYVPNNSFQEDTTIQSKITLDAAQDITVERLSDWQYYQYTNGSVFRANPYNVLYTGFVQQEVYIFQTVGRYEQWMLPFGVDKNGNVLNVSQSGNSQPTISGVTSPSVPNSLQLTTYQTNAGTQGTNRYLTSEQWPAAVNHVANYGPANWRNVVSTLNSQSLAYTGCATESDTNTFLALNNKVIYDSNTGMYYRIKLNRTDYTNQISVTSGNLFNTLADNVDESTYSNVSGTSRKIRITGSAGDSSFRVVFQTYQYTISLEDIPISAQVTLNNNRYHLEDQPYDMFCIPYSDTLQIYKNGTPLFRANKSLAINLGVEIGKSGGQGSVYDVQLLPYCPVRYCIKEDGTFDIGDSRVNYVKVGDDNVGIVLWATSSQFTLNIPYTIEVNEPKVENQCDMYRLCSPNFNGQFEFSAAMNGGVNYFNVDCSYKPYNPYIHINPNFGRLYGQDFNDARGLICGGDFSLPQVNDAWATYELNNKTYYDVFKRDIENMETTQDIERERERWSVAAGTISAAVQGLGSGALVNPGLGVLGGAVGVGVSGWAGAKDIELNNQLRQEALDYKEDMFNYNLDNIRALPYSLAKTSALTYNNKIFPILEYYTCTDEEKQAFRDKLKYNGMRVGRIGNIIDFIRPEQSYIKAKLIRLTDIPEDFHILNAIAEEMDKGVFI